MVRDHEEEFRCWWDEKGWMEIKMAMKCEVRSEMISCEDHPSETD